MPQQLYIPERDMPAKPGLLPSLDGLRAVSISIVLMGHFVLPTAARGVGAFGVVVFFFISGYLITRLLFAEHKRFGRIDLKQFYIRRVARLYPVLVVYTLVAVGVMLARAQPVSLVEISGVFFYFTNYLLAWYESHGIPLILPSGTLWSLAVEEHFYILMPCTALLFGMRPGPLIKASLATCAACLAFRLTDLLVWPDLISTRVIYLHSETRIDAVAVGVLMAALAETVRGRRLLLRLASPGWFVTGMAVLVLSFAVRQEFFQQTFRFTIQQFALYPVFCGILFGRQRLLQSTLNMRLPRWIGRLSYSLYVWGGGAKFLIGGMLAAIPPFLEAPLLLSVIFATAVASYYLVEMPVIALRKAMTARRAAAARPTQAEDYRPASSLKRLEQA